MKFTTGHSVIAQIEISYPVHKTKLGLGVSARDFSFTKVIADLIRAIGESQL
jgi:hypothetical protein